MPTRSLKNGIRAADKAKKADVIIEAAKEVGPSLFFSLLVITIGFPARFLPSRHRQGGFLSHWRIPRPLHALFLLPRHNSDTGLMKLFIRGKIRPEEKNPVCLILHKLYEPVAFLVLRFKKTVIIAAIVVLICTIYPFMKLGSEFMPPLYEGTLFYMPVTARHASVSVASILLQIAGQNIEKDP
jgi:Cu(I)/Ag(I) efflux system membrane protein CusA/SilA